MILGPQAPPPVDFLPFRIGAEANLAQQRPILRLGDVTIEADRAEFEIDERRQTFRGRVLLRYFETTVVADEAIVDAERGKVLLNGNLTLTDPFGIIRATTMEFDVREIREDGENDRYEFLGGTARNVDVEAFEGRFRADLLSVRPRIGREPGAITIHMEGVTATACDRETPDFEFRFKELQVHPGDVARWKGAEFRLGKGFKLPFPDYYATIGRQEAGLLLPQPTLSSGFRAGYRWRNLFEIGPAAQAMFEQSAAFDAVPSVNMHFAYALDGNRYDKRRPILIRNEDGERFKNGYWDNVTVREMRHEEESIAEGAMTAYIGRRTNVGSVQRLDTSLRFDREWFLGVQHSGKLGNASWQAQLDYGAVRPRLSSDGFRRFEGYATVLVPDVKLTEDVSFRVRGDLGTFFGNASGYSWFRPMVGLAYCPSKSLQVSLSYFKAQAFGTPQLDIDRLYSSHAIHLRTDVNLAATNLSVLLKYDFDRQQLYDIEIGLSQLMHCVRPYVAYRSSPGAISFGIQLEAQKLFESLSQRNPRRNQPPKT